MEGKWPGILYVSPPDSSSPSFFLRPVWGVGWLGELHPSFPVYSGAVGLQKDFFVGRTTVPNPPQLHGYLFHSQIFNLRPLFSKLYERLRFRFSMQFMSPCWFSQVFFFFFLLCILLIILYVFTGKEKKMCRKCKGEIRCHSLRRCRKAFDIFQYLLFLNILISVVLDVFFLYVYMNMCVCVDFPNTGLFFLKTRFLKNFTFQTFFHINEYIYISIADDCIIICFVDTNQRVFSANIDVM